MKRTITIAAFATLALNGHAFAAEPVPAAKPAAAAPAAVKPAPAKPLPKRAVGANSASAKAGAKPRTALSLDCSKQADAKGLHGKPREKFRSECMKPGQ